MKCARCGGNLRPIKGRSSCLEHETQSDCVFVDVEMGVPQWVTLNVLQEDAYKYLNLLEEVHALMGSPMEEVLHVSGGGTIRERVGKAIKEASNGA